MGKKIKAYLDPTNKKGWYALPHVLGLGAIFIGKVAVSALIALVVTQAVQRHQGYEVAPITAPRIHAVGGVPLPASWSLDKYVTRIHDQGASLSCVGQTIAQMIEIAQAERGHRWAMSSGYIYNQLTQGSQVPTSYSDAFPIATNQGNDTLKEFPWDGGNSYPQPNNEQIRQAYPYRFSEWRQIWMNDRYTIEYELRSGHPLAWAAPWYDSLANHFNDGTPADYQSGGFQYWHSTTIDAYSPYGLEIVNSFGPSWGHNGRLWISWNLFESSASAGAGIVVGVPAAPLPKPKPHPKPKPKPKKVHHFNLEYFERYRTYYHRKPIPAYDKHHHLVWSASIFDKHPEIGWIYYVGSWHKGKPGYMLYQYRYADVYAWPKTGKYKIVRHPERRNY